MKGCHLYKSIWTPVIGQELLVKPEDDNKLDKHTVSVIMSDHTVGHIPHIISRVSYFFLKRGGVIVCRITGKRQHGDGLGVSCV